MGSEVAVKFLKKLTSSDKFIRKSEVFTMTREDLISELSPLMFERSERT
jgi:hypothetical protein